MNSTLPQPVPKNLREQMLKRVSEMDETSLVRLYDLELLVEKIRLRDEMSKQAEDEMGQGKWEGLDEAIRQYRARNRAA